MPGAGTQDQGGRGEGSSRLLLLLGSAFCLAPWWIIYPPLVRFQIEIGLALGIALALAGLVHAGSVAKKVSRYAIQICVVLLGFRMDLHQVLRAGTQGLAFAVGTIVGTFLLGALLGRLLRTEGRISTLLSSGTAICGGSAIVAVSSVIGATAAEISVATAVIFILNGTALYLFPFLGEQMHLSAVQFGTWAGVAIHDVSSVVGAAQSYGHDKAVTAAAVDTATVVKLTRVLWIIPICIIAAIWMARRSASGPSASGAAPPSPAGASLRARLRGVAVPWFILFFILATGVRTLWQQHGEPVAIANAEKWIQIITRAGMALALFLIGAGLSRKALAAVGWRPLVQGVVMWVAISVVALAVVRGTVA